ncbi:unnamed protein product, partial [Adineta ricciae]
VLIERAGCSVTTRNNAQLTAIDLAEQYGFQNLAHDLRLRENPSLFSQKSSSNSRPIHLEKATVVRLVVKKRNIARHDASNQVDENELTAENGQNYMSTSSEKLVNSRFDLSELRARVEKHDANRRDDLENNVLMHSMDSLNQQNRTRQRSKLLSQAYAPWLRMSKLTPEAFHEEIQKGRNNLRKVRRDNEMKEEENNENDTSINRRSRHSQSVGAPVMPTEQRSWRRTGYETRSSIVPVSKTHQFISAASQSTTNVERPEWQRALIRRRQGLTDGADS